MPHVFKDIAMHNRFILIRFSKARERLFVDNNIKILVLNSLQMWGACDRYASLKNLIIEFGINLQTK